MTVESKKSGSSIKIYINNLLHLFIADRITSLQSWNMEDQFWIIEITTKNNKIKYVMDSLFGCIPYLFLIITVLLYFVKYIITLSNG